MGKKQDNISSDEDSEDFEALLKKAQKQTDQSASREALMKMKHSNNEFEIEETQDSKPQNEKFLEKEWKKQEKKDKKIKKEQKKVVKVESSESEDDGLADIFSKVKTEDRIKTKKKKSAEVKEVKEKKQKKQKKRKDSDSSESEGIEENLEEKKQIYNETKRGFTMSMVIPSSIVDNAQSMELKTYLVGQIAKAATIFSIQEIIIISDDKSKQMKGMMQDLTTTEFFVQNLEYLESPQYLRKTLFPRSPALRFAGLMNPLDAPHHLRANEWNQYREGCVIRRPVKDGKGSWVNIGLFKQDAQVDIQLQEDTRVTVKLEDKDFNLDNKYYQGKVVSQTEPFDKKGVYWGYQVRVAHSINEVFEDCPFDKGYDLKIGDCTCSSQTIQSSEEGDNIDFVNFKKYQDFKHGLIFFGGLGGIEGLVEDLETNENMKASNIRKSFDEYINACPEVGTRNLRTEESILMTLGALLPKLRLCGSKLKAGQQPRAPQKPAKSTLL